MWAGTDRLQVCPRSESNRRKSSACLSGKKDSRHYILIILMVMLAVGAVGMLGWCRGLRRELAGENDAAALVLPSQLFGDLRMVGTDVADEAVEKPGRLQPAA